MPAKKITTKARPNIFDYVDHILYLKDWCEYLKSEERISMRTIAKQAQLAIGYLPMCLSGKRILSTNVLLKLIPHLKLTSSEKRFLELLHKVGTSEDPNVRLQAVGDMTRLHAFKKKNSKELEVYKYLTNWHYVAIREMVALRDFNPDPLWIQERLNGKVSLASCSEAIDFLTSSGLVNVDENGKYSIPKVALSCKEGIYKLSLGEFYRQMFKFASNSIEQVQRSHRSILGHTVAISIDDLERVTEIFDDAIDKLHQLGQNTENPEQVYHIGFAAFPLTLKKNKKEDL